MENVVLTKYKRQILNHSNNFGKGNGFGKGGGHGRNRGGSFDIGGNCICTKCGEKVTHERGVKCINIKCPSCGHTMIREELLNIKE